MANRKPDSNLAAAAFPPCISGAGFFGRPPLFLGCPFERSLSDCGTPHYITDDAHWQGRAVYRIHVLYPIENAQLAQAARSDIMAQFMLYKKADKISLRRDL